MKARLTTFIFGLSMLFALGSTATPADAQVVVKIGPQHRYYHHRYYHTYYRHGHAYRSYRPY